MIRAVLKRTFTYCLPIHAVILSTNHPKVKEKDVYDAEEAIGLVESLNWGVAPGPFYLYRFDPQSCIDISKAKSVSESNLPDDLEIDEPVNLFGEPAIYQGGNCFQIFPNESPEANENDDDYARLDQAKTHVVKLRQASKMFYFPKFLINNLKKYIALRNIDVLYVDDFLTHLQLRNIKKALSSINKSKDTKATESTNLPAVNEDQAEDEDNASESVVVIDRLGIILEIFNKRTRNEITKLQVALVYLRYAKTLFVKEDDYFTTLADISNFNITKPQEVKLQIASAKQSGRRYAIAGEGESQQELQRRITKNLEKVIKTRLEKALTHQQQTIERNNKHKMMTTIALIGYTNAGKSAIMNLFAESEIVESRDQLFQTLYTVTRKVKIRGSFEVLLVDTIGFISNLPHELIPTFVSTLEHLKTSDLILHVRDFSHPQSDAQNQTVHDVLKMLNMTDSQMKKKFIEVRNKVDKYLEKHPELSFENLVDTDNVIHISATEQLNINTFKKAIISKIYTMFGCYEHRFRHDFNGHQERVDWLRE
jgi:small GTP-binding protein